MLQPFSGGDTDKRTGPGHIVLVSLALAAVILAVYLQVRTHQFVNLDDYGYITGNPHVAGGLTGANIVWAFSSFAEGNWHPLTWLSHMADVQLYGMNPGGHHLTSVVIHTASSLLLLLLLCRTTGHLWPSAFVAALFALHPLHVESVAWAAERKDVLSGFFWFLTLLFYCAYAERRTKRLYLLSLCSFALGLMAKPMLVTLPLVMLLMDYWPLGRYRHEEREQPPLQRAMALTKEKIPFFICALVSGCLTVYAQYRGGAVSGLKDFPLQLRIENALTACVRYLGKTLWPDELAVLYPMPASFPLWQVTGSLALLLLLSGAALRCRKRHPWFAVGWFWFLITLAPVIGIIQVGNQSLADRYTYLPLVGLFMTAAWGVPELARGLPGRKGMLALLAASIIIASAVSSWRQLGYWRDSITLFRHTLRITGGNASIHGNLGLVLAEKGLLDEAIREYVLSLRLNPGDGRVHNNLGIALAGKGHPDAAIGEFREALRLNPADSGAHNNLGIVLFEKGLLDEAIGEFREALRINPDDMNASRNLASAIARKRKHRPADRKMPQEQGGQNEIH